MNIQQINTNSTITQALRAFSEEKKLNQKVEDAVTRVFNALETEPADQDLKQRFYSELAFIPQDLSRTHFSEIKEIGNNFTPKCLKELGLTGNNTEEEVQTFINTFRFVFETRRALAALALKNYMSKNMNTYKLSEILSQITFATNDMEIFTRITAPIIHKINSLDAIREFLLLSGEVFVSKCHENTEPLENFITILNYWITEDTRASDIESTGESIANASEKKIKELIENEELKLGRMDKTSIINFLHNSK